jgi:3-oxoacyl-[acyl-carrier-protein] synthase-3
MAIREAGITAADIDAIIVATITPDMIFPSTACCLQNLLKAPHAAAFDLAAACSGFIYALAVAKGFIETGMYRNVLLVGAETLSKITDWQDRNTCVLFGDGAGAMVLGRSDVDGNGSIRSVYLGSDGSYGDLLKLPASGSRMPLSQKVLDERQQFIKMDGREVFKVAVMKMVEASHKALAMAHLTTADLALVIPHQANLRIIEAIAKRLELPQDKVFVNLHKYGNASASTVIVGLDEARRSGTLKKGDLVELVAFGGGFTWGATILEMP